MADFLTALPLGKTLPPGQYGAERVEPVTLRSIATEACTLAAGRDPEAVIGKARAAFAFELRDAPRRGRAGDIAFVGAGPGRWLVLSEASGLRDRLETALAPEGSVFEQSGGVVMLEAGGPAMRAVLAKLVPIDLHPSAFAPGDAATTTAAHVNLTLWLEEGEHWRLVVGRSFLAAFLRAFACAAAEFGLDWAG